MKILALIPARSGSKGIINKNIMDYNGKPMIYMSIKNALESKYNTNNNMRIIVSTDSQEYKDIFLKYGAEVPILRPKEISNDLSNDYEFTIHMLDYLKNNENYIPDIVVQLRPTYPTRKTSDLDTALSNFIHNYNNYDSLRSVQKIDKSPYKMYSINNNTQLMPLFNTYKNYNEPYNLPRQLLPDIYLHNGCIDIFKTSIVYEKKSITGDIILPYIMDENNDIDTLNDIYKINNNK